MAAKPAANSGEDTVLFSFLFLSLLSFSLPADNGRRKQTVESDEDRS